ncbi:hypothetical protein Hypma_009511 [Hypsizygus marmoreus]|uniref:Uncharacterized protein n=1 Tax=Hypsizygus marmoreus TaxID=39966 RepID=A0A369JTT6_HYPMA|nr:hypothetical protein Hypma_009511 [Hypsizygus marmoreus]
MGIRRSTTVGACHYPISESRWTRRLKVGSCRLRGIYVFPVHCLHHAEVPIYPANLLVAYASPSCTSHLIQ